MPALSEEGDEGLLLLHAAKDGDCTRLRELVMIYGISVDFEEEGSGVTALCVSAGLAYPSSLPQPSSLCRARFFATLLHFFDDS